MHRMLIMAESENQRKNIKKKQLHGIELQSNMFAVAATNMILRRDGNCNLECSDFLAKIPAQLKLKGATVGLMPPLIHKGQLKSHHNMSFLLLRTCLIRLL